MRLPAIIHNLVLKQYLKNEELVSVIKNISHQIVSQTPSQFFLFIWLVFESKIVFLIGPENTILTSDVQNAKNLRLKTFRSRVGTTDPFRRLKI